MTKHHTKHGSNVATKSVLKVAPFGSSFGGSGIEGATNS